ncbi:MAG: radical SAM protein [bacterium]|nr:radical SAM protein [bacterium]
MKIQTFSIVVGTRACNARCPFCVSHMTGFAELPKRGDVHAGNFMKACRLGQLAGTTTVLMTSKGEPTLYPTEIGEYLQLLGEWQFPFIELQTNALDIGRLAAGDNAAVQARGLTRTTLQAWRGAGLNTIAISVVDVEPGPNRRVYLDGEGEYPDLARTVGYLHETGFTVRLCVMMQQGAVCTSTDVERVIAFCKAHQVEQLTIRPIRKPERTSGLLLTTARYVETHGLDKEQITDVRDHVKKCGTRLLSLMHGAEVYDVDGQNVCLSDCLTVNQAEDGDNIRTLIFYSDGRLTYDWQHPGAVLLGGR